MFVLAACAVSAFAANNEEAELLKVLKQETAIATKTRMNSDFVPGIVTILRGDQLRAYGVRTVWEAMAFVPGVEPSRDAAGTPSVVVRGIPFPFNSGNIQILLNGSPIAREAAGLNESVLLMPTSQIERIEFIRGPGSVLYGDFAFQGLINIVTRKQGNEIGGGVDSKGARETNLLISGKSGDLDASINLAGMANDDAILPLASNGDETRFSGVASLSYGSFSFLAQGVNRHLYDVTTSIAFAPPKDDETNWSAEARYRASLGRNAVLDARVQYLYNDLNDSGIGFKGDEVNTTVELHWSGWRRQRWLAGIEYSDGSIDRASQVLQLPPPPEQGPGAGPGSGPLFTPIVNRHRRVTSAYLQDQAELTSSLSATIGARYDDNSEVGSRVTPRAALVWRAAEHHIVKAQYSEGLRSPAFFELYGQEVGGVPGASLNDLEFEVNHTTEINYVYERPRLTFRATAFDTRISSMIFKSGPLFQFGNVARARAQGAEFELTQEIGATLHIDANLSYVDSRDNRNLPGHVWAAVAAAPHWMGNLGLLWKPRANLVYSLRWHHVGRAQGGYGGYDVADLSMRRNNLLGGAVDWEVGINNLLDQKVTYLIPTPNAVNQQRFQNRIAWTRLVWHW